MPNRKSDTQPWKCKNEHVLGQVMRDASGVRILLFYRQALDPRAERLDEVDIAAVIEGYVTKIRCSICGKVRTWKPGEESMQKLLGSVKGLRPSGKSQP